MICTSKTPLRVSLFGGGTDYPAYFERARGAVIGFAIDKYIYMSALRLGAYVDYRYRLSYSKLEHVDLPSEIEHPVVRELLRHYAWDEPVDFSFQADLPASAGLGSSSAFTVGFINTISHMMKRPRTRLEIAQEAIFAEQVLLNENVGVQDQMHAAFGGFNRFDFSKGGYRITPVNVTGAMLAQLTDWMVLVFTGIKRRATDTVVEQIANTRGGRVDNELGLMLELVDRAQAILEDRSNPGQVPGLLAGMLHEAWELKKRLSAGMSGGEIDALYTLCRESGALGGKLCGAGGGGFLLMVVPPEKRQSFEEAVGERRCVRFQIDLLGTRILSDT